MDEVAALLAIVAAVSFALAATLWQKAQLGLEGASLRHPRPLLAVLAEPVRLLGLAAQGVGIGLQAAALDRGRVSILQPLLVTAVIWALPLGYFLTGQRITKRMVSGAIIVVAGLGVFAAFGDPAGGVDDAPLSDWIIPIVVILAASVGLFLLARRLGATGRAATLGTLAGVLYGLPATLLKPVVESLHAGGRTNSVETWGVAVLVRGGWMGCGV